MVSLALYTGGGVALGLAYHRLIGCRSGACAIWANPWASAIYGALVGFMIGSSRTP